MKRFIVTLGLGVFLASSAWAQGYPDDPLMQPPPAKHHYLVTTTHTPEQCMSALDEMAAKNKRMLSKMQWGCGAGDHTGYAFVDAVDDKAALAMLPESSRATAKVIEVAKFTPRDLKKLHARKPKK